MVEMSAQIFGRVAQPVDQLGSVVGKVLGRSPAAQKLLLLAGAGAAYAGGIGFLLMFFRMLADL